MPLLEIKKLLSIISIIQLKPETMERICATNQNYILFIKLFIYLVATSLAFS